MSTNNPRFFALELCAILVKIPNLFEEDDMSAPTETTYFTGCPYYPTDHCCSFHRETFECPCSCHNWNTETAPRPGMYGALKNAFDRQISYEFEASYFYLSVASYFESADLPGFAHWARRQSAEETAHGMMLFNFVHDRGERVCLHPIGEPDQSYTSPLNAMSDALDREQIMSGRINALYDFAQRCKDYASSEVLHKMVAEQVEEVQNLTTLVAHLRLLGKDGSSSAYGTGLLILDAKIGGIGL